jgi:hypothetical protein
MAHPRRSHDWSILGTILLSLAGGSAAFAQNPGASRLQPNLVNNIARPLRYTPDGQDSRKRSRRNGRTRWRRWIAAWWPSRTNPKVRSPPGKWDFGDGSTSTEQNPVHQYNAGRDYTTILEVEGPAGKSRRANVWGVSVK